MAHAQGSQLAAVRSDTELPAVTVEAPKPAVRRAPKKPAEHAAVAPRPAPKPAEPPQQPAPVVSSNIDGGGVNASYGTPPIKQRYQLPQESFTITSKQIDETINLKDPEDAVKYMPSLFVRKRNDGDNQAVLATRSMGPQFQRAHADLLRRSPDLGADRQQQLWRLAEVEFDFARGDRADRFPQRAILGRLSR